MKTFKQALFLTATFAISLPGYAAEPSAADQAFEESSPSVSSSIAGSAETVASLGAMMMAGDHSMRILEESRDLESFEMRARAEVVRANPAHQDLLDKKGRFEQLELYRTKGAGLRGPDLAEHAALKKELASRAVELKGLEKIVEDKRLTLMATEPVWTPKGYVNAGKYHNAELRRLKLQRAGLVGAASLMLLDGGRRFVESFTTVRPGYSAATIESRSSAPGKSAPASAPVSKEGGNTGMSVE